MPHRRAKCQSELPDWKRKRNRSHKQARARVEHAFARMKGWKKFWTTALCKATECTTDARHRRLHHLAPAG
jgi:hypothetical protein